MIQELQKFTVDCDTNDWVVSTNADQDSQSLLLQSVSSRPFSPVRIGTLVQRAMFRNLSIQGLIGVHGDETPLLLQVSGVTVVTPLPVNTVSATNVIYDWFCTVLVCGYIELALNPANINPISVKAFTISLDINTKW
jgi:hypothetical protein